MDQPLKDRTILVVEDDIVLATDVAALLTGAGCKAVLPTTSVAAALSTIVRYVVDAAVLDVNVQNEWVFPVAHALDRAGVPFVFLTGKPFVRKPHVPQDLIGALARSLTAGTSEVRLATVDGEPVSTPAQHSSLSRS